MWPEVRGAGRQAAQAGDRLDQRRLAGAVRAEQGDLLAALEHDVDVAHERVGAGRVVGGADADRRRLQLEHDARRRLGLREPQLEAPLLPGGLPQPGLDALDLRELGLGLLGLVLLGVEAVVEALQLLDLLEVLLVLAAHEVEPRLALAQVGGEVAALRLDVLVLHGEDAPPDLLEQAAVVRHQQEGALVVGEEALEPLHRVDVEVVGGLVEQQQVGVGEQRARQRDARELAAGQREQARAPACRRAGRGPRRRRRGGRGSRSRPRPRSGAGAAGRSSSCRAAPGCARRGRRAAPRSRAARPRARRPRRTPRAGTRARGGRARAPASARAARSCARGRGRSCPSRRARRRR